MNSSYFPAALSTVTVRALSRVRALARHLEILLSNQDIMSFEQRQRAHDWLEAARDKAISQLGFFTSKTSLLDIYSMSSGVTFQAAAHIFAHTTRLDLAGSIWCEVSNLTAARLHREATHTTIQWCKAWDEKYSE
jgi:hypothetical protein